MDTIRLFLRTNSFRSFPKQKVIIATYNRSQSSPYEINDSNDDFSIVTEDKQNEKLTRENIKSFISTQHPTSSSVLSRLPLLNLELETCSGLSTETSEKSNNSIIAASASESISNAFSSTNSRSSKRRSSLPTRKRRQRRRSSIPEQHIHYIQPPITSVRRTRSQRYSDRLRNHSIKTIHASTEKLRRRYIQVNTSKTNITNIASI
jgi:hypothetical protein